MLSFLWVSVGEDAARCRHLVSLGEMVALIIPSLITFYTSEPAFPQGTATLGGTVTSDQTFVSQDHLGKLSLREPFASYKTLLKATVAFLRQPCLC